MAQAGDRSVGAAGGQAGGAPAQPRVLNVAAAAVQANVDGMPAAPAAPAAVVGEAAPVAAMLAGPVIPNMAGVGMQPIFHVDALMSLPLPTKSNFFKDYEIYPRVD